MKRSLKIIARSFLVVLIGIHLVGPLVMLASGEITLNGDWRNADRSSTRIAPPAEETGEAVVQFYSARAFGWRGLFAVHTWVATKREKSNVYTVHHVLGWNEYRGLPVVASRPDIPDRAWYGYRPDIILDLRGKQAERLIDDINLAVRSYPYVSSYTAWPGPNSNTFIAHIGRQVPQLRLELPSIAIGKDYLLNGSVFSKPPSGQGFQFSLFGLLGLIISSVEGLEINILGLVSGFDHRDGAIKIPGIGELDFIHN